MWSGSDSVLDSASTTYLDHFSNRFSRMKEVLQKKTKKKIRWHGGFHGNLCPHQLGFIVPRWVESTLPILCSNLPPPMWFLLKKPQPLLFSKSSLLKVRSSVLLFFGKTDGIQKTLHGTWRTAKSTAMQTCGMVLNLIMIARRQTKSQEQARPPQWPICCSTEKMYRLQFRVAGTSNDCFADDLSISAREGWNWSDPVGAFLLVGSYRCTSMPARRRQLGQRSGRAKDRQRNR